MKICHHGSLKSCTTFLAESSLVNKHRLAVQLYLSFVKSLYLNCQPYSKNISFILLSLINRRFFFLVLANSPRKESASLPFLSGWGHNSPWSEKSPITWSWMPCLLARLITDLDSSFCPCAFDQLTHTAVVPPSLFLCIKFKQLYFNKELS